MLPLEEGMLRKALISETNHRVCQGVVRKNQGLPTLVAMDMVEIGRDLSGSIHLLPCLHVHWEGTSAPEGRVKCKSLGESLQPLPLSSVQ